METALSIYAGIAALTFFWGVKGPRPTTIVEWATLVALSAFWPLFLVWVAAGETRE